MILKNKIATLSVGLLLTTASYGQATKTVIDYLRVAGPISFEKDSYNLAWTSHPADNYYKQEYLAKGDTLEKFKRLILIDVLVGKTKIKDLVATKIAELNKIKASNPIVQYQTFEKGDEIMLDFLLSENTPDGKLVSTIERNVYRYKNITGKNGQKAVLLFGVSNRAYGNDIDDFLLNLKDNRHDLLNAVGAFDLPEIVIAK
ncbi:MAG: hypothetical protein WAU24_07590 [Chitinophagaceae bacterium]